MVLPRRLLSLSFAALAAVIASAVMTQPVAAWNAPIVTKGNKFFDAATGLEFRQKGMAYYPRPNAGEMYEVNNYDWTTDDHEDVWGSHIGMMKQLGVNTIRLYSVDPSKSHDKFMCACAEAGIYVLVGITAPCENCSILDAQPPACYPSQLFTRAQMVYNAFAVYDNVLGFSVGNENNLQTKYGADGTTTAPCVKAFLRDVRRYAMTCAGSLRQVPIGLDIADIPPRGQWLQYYDCAVDKDEMTRAEWVGFNPYVECDPVAHKTYAQSAGLQNLMKEYAATGYARPIMFGEFGCVLGANTLGGYENQRSFYDARWMNEESEMMNEIVGGNVFEFSTERNHVAGETLSKAADPGRFGVGFFQPSDCDHANKKCNFIKYPEFDNLQRAYTTTKPSNLSLSQFTPSRSAILECPTGMSTALPPMPTVTTLECSVRQPVCNKVKSNDHKKDAKKSVPLGNVVAPSNEKRADDIVAPTKGDGSPRAISGSDVSVAGAHRIVVLVSCLVVVLVQAGVL